MPTYAHQQAPASKASSPAPTKPEPAQEALQSFPEGLPLFLSALETPAFQAVAPPVSRAGGNLPEIQRKCAGCEAGEAPCEACAGENLEEDLPVQPKLVVNEPGDAFEQEADRVADRVMRMPLSSQPLQEDERADGPAQTPAIQRLEEDELSEEDEEFSEAPEEERVQLQSLSGSSMSSRTVRPAAGNEARTTPAPSSLVQSLATPPTGSPLPREVTGRIEPVLGRRLDDVRVHDDAPAQAAAHALRARAFTHRNHIWLGSGQSPNDLALMAHESAHVAQQTGIGPAAAPSTEPARRGTDMVARQSGDPASGPLIIQRASYHTADNVNWLELEIPFQTDIINIAVVVSDEVGEYFEADDALAETIQTHLGGIFNPADQPLHETAEYLEGPAVEQLIGKGVRKLPIAGTYNFEELATLLHGRTALFYSTTLLPGTTNILANAFGVEPAEIDWNDLLPAVREVAEAFEVQTLVEASRRDRYLMFLDMLAAEAAGLPVVVGAVALDAGDADEALYNHVINSGSALFGQDVFDFHSEKFLEEWAGWIGQISYVPEGFDPEVFRPVEDTTSIDARREEIIADYIENEAESRVVMYILDQWTESGESPEDFLATLDVEEFRVELVAELAAELVEKVKSDPALMGALRSRAADKARFIQVQAIYFYALGQEAINQQLAQIFATELLSEVSPEDYAIAADPYAYYASSSTIAGVVHNLLSNLTPNGPIELQVITAGAALLEAEDQSAAYAGLFLLPELLGYLSALKTALEDQETRTQEALEDRLDLDFEDIAETVRSLVEHADAFIRDEWIPMLKQIALERAADNLAELRYLDEHWVEIQQSRTLQFAQGAAELDFLASGLESGRFDQIEYEGRIVRRAGVPHLRSAAQVLRAAGLQQLDTDAQDEQREKIRGVIEDYDTIVEDIQDGSYDPLDYSSAVYAEARQRLGIEEMESVTVGMVLSRTVTASSNPFLEYAIVRWQFKEGLERDFERGMTLVGLGFLSLAAALVPGVGGAILAAIDIGLGIYSGAEHVADARSMVRMARLDIHGSIVGVSEADAEAALNDAWIGLAVTVVLTVGPAAFRAGTSMRRPGGARVPRVRPDVRLNAAERGVLGRTRSLHGSNLSPTDLASEASVAARARPQPSTMPGFAEEIHLPNDHIWRRRGTDWCRFSVRPFCMPSSSLPTNLRRRAYRDVARTLDEGLDAAGNLVRDRGHSFADHGAQTTPAQHLRRLTTGVTPGGSTRAIPPTSSRFATHRAQLDAYESALNDLGANYLRTSGTPKAEYSGTLSLPGCGKSYSLAADGSLVETTVGRFNFFFRRNAQGWYDLITMYPVP